MANPRIAVCTITMVVFASTLASAPVVAQENSQPFIVTQGSKCVQVTPLGNGTKTASAFYDYRSTVTDKKGLYSSYGTRDIQKPNTSQVFIYNGSDGLSLVFLTGALGSASDHEGGGSTYTSDLSGLPPNGKWVVEDDTYTHNDDTFQTNLSGGRRAHFVQVQNGNRTDGAAFLGLGSTGYRAIHIRIRFNSHSAIYPYDNWHGLPAQNRIAHWIVRSGDGTTTELNMNQPITIAPGTCAGGIEHNTRSSTTPISPSETAMGPYIPSNNDTPATKNPTGPPLTVSTPNSTSQRTVTTAPGGTNRTTITRTTGPTAMTATRGMTTTRTTATRTQATTETQPTAATPITTAPSTSEPTNTTGIGGSVGTTEQASREKGNGSANGANTNGSGSSGGSGAFGPGFGIGPALAAMLILAMVTIARRINQI